MGQIDFYTSRDLEELEGQTFDYIEDIDGFSGLEIKTLSEFLNDLNAEIYPTDYFVTYIYLKNRTDLWQI